MYSQAYWLQKRDGLDDNQSAFIETSLSLLLWGCLFKSLQEIDMKIEELVEPYCWRGKSGITCYIIELGIP